MMQDEYGKLPEEYPVLPDEYAVRPSVSSSHVQQEKGQKKKQKRHREALLKYFCASSMTVVILPGIFGNPFFHFPIQKDLNREDVLVEEYTDYETGETVLVYLPQEQEYSRVEDRVQYQSDDDAQNASGNQNDAVTLLRPVEEKLEQPEDDPNPFVEMVVCTECNGTGIHCEGDPTFGYDRGNGEGYPGCGGTGYSVCPDKWCNNGVRLCDNCMGSGTDEKNAEGICEICNGQGTFDCEFCHNTGIAVCLTINDHVECARCGGTGMMFPW